jgi:hypothetical protein
MINVGSIIKINDELCPENERSNKRFQFGALNYIAIMLDWEFEVVREFKDEFHGDMVECKITNSDNIKSNIVLRTQDTVLAKSNKFNLTYEIIGKTGRFDAEIRELKREENDLLLVRAEEKRKGTPITDKTLIQNWSEVKSVRNKIKRYQENTDKVFVVKHSSGTYEIDCAEEQIPTKLRSLIRSMRADRRKVYPVTKEIGGGMTLEKLGNVMVKPGKFLELNEKYALNIIKAHKKPTTNDNYVGIEIEMLSPKSIEEMNKEFIKSRLHKYVNVGTDGSIRSDISGVHAMELRVCLPENLLATHLKMITEVLRKTDSYANRSCGMHVHVDMRNRDPELCYRNFFKVQNIMLQAQPLTRRTNQYCKPSTIASKKLKDFSSNGDDNVRRQAINTDSYHKNDMKTIEIRVHEGATKFKDIFNWVNFLVATASLKKDLDAPINTIKELRSANFVNELVINHLNERIEEYSA